jgi:hypothetical protein
MITGMVNLLNHVIKQNGGGERAEAEFKGKQVPVVAEFVQQLKMRVASEWKKGHTQGFEEGKNYKNLAAAAA